MFLPKISKEYMLLRDFKSIGTQKANHLSIVMLVNGLYYGIFSEAGTLIQHHSYSEILFSKESDCETILNDTSLKDEFSSITILTLTGSMHQLSVPDEALITSLPGMNYKEIYSEKLPGQDIYNYFGLTPHQQSLLDKLFGENNFKIYNSLFALTGYYLGRQSPMVHVHIEERLVTIYAQKGGEIKFYNTFHYSAPTDVLYFITAVCQMSGIFPHHDEINLSGTIEKDSPVFKLIYDYVNKAQLITDDTFSLPREVSLDAHYYFLHFAAKLCVL